MKKIVISLIVLMAVMCLCSCKNDSSGTHLIEDIEKLSTELQGMSQAEVHKFLGEPVGQLSGFWGDIYQNSEKQGGLYEKQNWQAETINKERKVFYLCRNRVLCEQTKLLRNWTSPNPTPTR